MGNNPTTSAHMRARPAMREMPRQDLILDLLDKAEALRQRQNLLARKLAYVLATGVGDFGYDDYDEPVDVGKLQRAWNEFIAVGGVTGDDLRRFLRGGQLTGNRTIRRRHLRLVRSNAKPLVMEAA
jgi:hypothetical protein